LPEEWRAPLVLPVHNLGAGGNTPPYWLPPPRGLGWPYALFNAFFLRRGYSVSMLHPGVRAWVDSGGFLYLEAPQRRLAGLHSPRGRGAGARWLPGRGEWLSLAAEVLRRQERFGAEVAFTLDAPLPPASQLDPDCCPGEVAERLRMTAEAAATAYQLRTRRSMRLLVVLHHNGPRALRLLLDTLSRELRERAGMRLDEVDGYALGGLVPHSGKWWLLARRLQETRRHIGWSKWLHILGVASPHNIPLLYAAGADSMDSKTYIIAAAKRLYYQPPGAKPARIDLRTADGAKPRCSCPACRVAATLSELRGDTKLLAIHNLHVTLEAAKLAAKAHAEAKLHKLLKQLAQYNPRLSKALIEIKEIR